MNMPSFSGINVTVTVSSTPRLVVRLPPMARLTRPKLGSSPPEPKPPPPKPDVMLVGKPPDVFPKLSQAADAADRFAGGGGGAGVFFDEVSGSSECVVKALVVLSGALIIGRAAVVSCEGVASL